MRRKHNGACGIPVQSVWGTTCLCSTNLNNSLKKFLGWQDLLDVAHSRNRSARYYYGRNRCRLVVCYHTNGRVHIRAGPNARNGCCAKLKTVGPSLCLKSCTISRACSIYRLGARPTFVCVLLPSWMFWGTLWKTFSCVRKLVLAGEYCRFSFIVVYILCYMLHDGGRV